MLKKQTHLSPVLRYTAVFCCKNHDPFNGTTISNFPGGWVVRSSHLFHHSPEFSAPENQNTTSSVSKSPEVQNMATLWRLDLWGEGSDTKKVYECWIKRGSIFSPSPKFSKLPDSHALDKATVARECADVLRAKCSFLKLGETRKVSWELPLLGTLADAYGS